MSGNISTTTTTAVVANMVSTLTGKERICDVGGTNGVVFPGRPLGDTENRFKVLFYGFLLLYSFIGVSIVADMFMAAIERVTSKKRRIKVPGTTNRYITTNVWNETVANLTLMALGSSAPEILLAVNETFKLKFFSGALGPSTIVGSAAFNLFVIIAVCINAIPSGETRRIKEMGVFIITAIFSVFAYVWMLFIVQFNSPDIVTVMEGSLTFLFFPMLVTISYLSDAGFLEFITGPKEGPPEEKVKKIDTDKTGVSKGNTLNGAQFQGRQWGNNGYNGDDSDPTEDKMSKADKAEERDLVAECCSTVCKMFTACCMKSFKLFCYPCRKIMRRGKPEEEAAIEELEELEPEVDMEDPEIQILDEDGEPMENEVGIITFKCDSMEVEGNAEENTYTVTVLRKNGTEGRISCKYRMEEFTAMNGYDYVDEEGTVDFKNGVSKAEIEITILPKDLGERDDSFQIILEEPSGEAIFNPNSDGGEEQCLLTVIILNANRGTSRRSRFFGMLDGWVNMDEMRQGSAAWYDQITEAYYCNGSAEEQEEAKFLDWVMHFIFFPWQMIYAILTPPPPYLGGKICFVVALMHIGALTAVIGDMAELFGCAAGIDDNITAISVVALGTSLPDLFASKTAATQDEWADASIVNVTGSNSVNVFLGIGVPWMIASIYWWAIDAREHPKWMAAYGEQFLDRCPTGCFVVESGDLAFSVVVFTTGALVCLVVICIRRVVYDGELGGPAGSDSKACSSFLLVLLWVFYISLSVWKSVYKITDWPTQIIAIAICIPVVVVLMFFFGLMLQLLRISKDYIGTEGFFGIAICISLLIVRMIYFLMFQ